MIMFKQGDLLVEDAEAIVNTVNCVGVMGRGIALQFKKQYPENYKYYESACKRGDVIPGKMLVYETVTLTNPIRRMRLSAEPIEWGQHKRKFSARQIAIALERLSSSGLISIQKDV